MRARVIGVGLWVALAGCEVEQTPWPGAGEVGAVVDGAAGDAAADGAVRDEGTDRGAQDAGARFDAALDPDAGAGLDAAGDASPVVDAMADVMVDVMPDAMPDVMPDVMPDAMPEPVVYRWLIVVDDSEEENRAGTAGADICGAVARCGDDTRVGVAAERIGGDGVVCDGVPSDVCGMTRRDDARAALDDGAACDGGSSPSDYVSLGIAGELAIDFGRDLRGCSVAVVELLGRDAEAFAVYACATPALSGESCLDGGAALGSQRGGRLEVEL